MGTETQNEKGNPERALFDNDDWQCSKVGGDKHKWERKSWEGIVWQWWLEKEHPERALFDNDGWRKNTLKGHCLTMMVGERTSWKGIVWQWLLTMLKSKVGGDRKMQNEKEHPERSLFDNDDWRKNTLKGHCLTMTVGERTPWKGIVWQWWLTMLKSRWGQKRTHAKIHPAYIYIYIIYGIYDLYIIFIIYTPYIERLVAVFVQEFWSQHGPTPHCVIMAPNEPITFPWGKKTDAVSTRSFCEFAEIAGVCHKKSLRSATKNDSKSRFVFGFESYDIWPIIYLRIICIFWFVLLLPLFFRYGIVCWWVETKSMRTSDLLIRRSSYIL